MYLRFGSEKKVGSKIKSWEKKNLEVEKKKLEVEKKFEVKKSWEGKKIESIKKIAEVEKKVVEVKIIVGRS